MASARELQPTYPYWLAGEPAAPNHDLEVRDKYSGRGGDPGRHGGCAGHRCGIAAAVAAAEPMRRLGAYERQAVLQHCVRRFQERFDELAMSLCVEAGKPIKDSRGEVTRLIDTFRIAAEEATRIHGEVLPMDISPRARGYSGMWKRVPIGPCSFISPFNFPLNLAAHKIAPALAVGCPFVLKPASLTPIGALLIGEILAETELPRGAFSILPCRRDGADLFTTDERLKLLSFTGSPEVGWELKAKAGKKKVVLELGGNAAVIVDETGTTSRMPSSASSSAPSTSRGRAASACSASWSTSRSTRRCASGWWRRRARSSWAIRRTSARSSDR